MLFLRLVSGLHGSSGIPKLRLYTTLWTGPDTILALKMAVKKVDFLGLLGVINRTSL